VLHACCLTLFESCPCSAALSSSCVTAWQTRRCRASLHETSAVRELAQFPAAGLHHNLNAWQQATWEKNATDEASAVPQSHPGFRMYSAAEFKAGYVEQQPYTWFMEDDDRQVGCPAGQQAVPTRVWRLPLSRPKPNPSLPSAGWALRAGRSHAVASSHAPAAGRECQPYCGIHWCKPHCGAHPQWTLNATVSEVLPLHSSTPSTRSPNHRSCLSLAPFPPKDGLSSSFDPLSPSKGHMRRAGSKW
jgi:hypothetical protein